MDDIDRDIGLMNLGHALALCKAERCKLDKRIADLEEKFGHERARVRDKRLAMQPRHGRASVVPESLADRGLRRVVQDWPAGAKKAVLSPRDLPRFHELVPSPDTATYYEAAREYVSSMSGIVRHWSTGGLSPMLENVDTKSGCIWVRWYRPGGGSTLMRHQIWVLRRLPVCTEAWKLPEAGGMR
jgi:hypothetical protein